MRIQFQLINGDTASLDPTEVAVIRQSRNTITIVMKGGYTVPLDHAKFKTIAQAEAALKKGA